MIIAVTGKGGVGKTLLSSLIIRNLTKSGKNILAIDADPDSNLPEALGVEVTKTVGDAREELKKEVRSGNTSPEMDMWNSLDYKIMESIIETPEFDLLVMGRPEGSGCYCAVNNMLRKIIETVSSNYDIVVIDTEAGLEHLSRRTTQNVDTLLVVTDSSKRGILTASRIKELAKELDISFKNLYLVLNRIKPENEENVRETVKDFGLDIIGIIYDDELTESYDMEGKPLFELPDDSETVNSVSKIVEKILG
ncbi:ATP-binding protein [Methanococcus maripaludis]|uniref:CO dehydrogenase maturation factor n=1 Tax=Methanococcus maripaludis TaxID=39152 RepID=A0A2L1C7R8_METMI|nr:AAA family ATPase [Methanococcus maripaludis]AVB75428.1 Septum site-determining protein MinD [Methanococcus maripaludis]MBA2863753.1 CO dehydrogenase maturation factor [Methanococcus maripaludis]MBB6496241.1 CO dehydrogenase maturation factor [Methanococcus maripaludis]